MGKLGQHDRLFFSLKKLLIKLSLLWFERQVSSITSRQCPLLSSQRRCPQAGIRNGFVQTATQKGHYSGCFKPNFNEFVSWNIKNFLSLYSILRWHMYLKSFLIKNKDLFILHIQYHSCWWLGDTRSKGICSHGIDLLSLNILVSASEGLTP